MSDVSNYRFFYFFFFNDTATTEIYTLSLHDALPISAGHPWPTTSPRSRESFSRTRCSIRFRSTCSSERVRRSEEHTSELQSHVNLVCRLLLEKKKQKHPSVRSTARRYPTEVEPSDTS